MSKLLNIYQWISANITLPSRRASYNFYKVVELSPIQVYLTYKERVSSKKTNGKIALVNNLFANFSNAPIDLKALQISNLSTENILALISDHYSNEAKSGVLSFIGSSEIIGSPINVANNISNSVTSYFIKPGQAPDPVGLIKFIGQGPHSLISTGINATLGSASQITSTVSKGLLSVIEDEEYFLERERNQDVKKNIITGVGYGIHGMVTSIGSGISGIFVKPIMGSKRGVKGFFKGLGQGLAGVVIKPVTGILDLFSNTTEGIKNTISSDPESNLKKVRELRAFYGGSFREFSAEESVIAKEGSMYDIVYADGKVLSIHDSKVILWSKNKKVVVSEIKDVQYKGGSIVVSGKGSVSIECDEYSAEVIINRILSSKK
jgi:vacuolar protein sorting-associated protein 13A/C